MDSNDPRRRQSNPSGYASQQGLLQSPQYPATSVSDRYRSTQLGIHSPTSAPTTGRSGNLPGYGYGYGESSAFGGSAMNPASISYQAEYGQEPQQRQTQQYGQYGSSLMYNVPSQQQAPSQSPYEGVQQYQQPRQSAAIEVLSNQFGVAQQYYGAGESGPTSAPISTMGGQSAQTQYPQMPYSQQSSGPRESISTGYGMADTTQSSQAGYGQAEYSSNQQEAAYTTYQSQLKKVFGDVRDGKLVEAAGSLVNISDWLLTNAESLGTSFTKQNDNNGN
jgi:hypothetical protein